MRTDNLLQLQEGLQQVFSTYGESRVLYLWGMDTAHWISDSNAIFALIKAIASSPSRIDRLLLAGRAGNALERCYLESWIGIERSLGTAIADCSVSVAIDQPSGDDQRWLRRLWLQLCQPVISSRLYHAEQAFRLVLTAAQIETASAPLMLEQMHTILITGGVGELGLLLATELSNNARSTKERKGRLNLILNGRSALSAAKQASIDQLCHVQCHIFYLQADCTERQEFATALAKILPQSGPIEALFHAAGLKAGGSILDSTAENWNAVLRTKISSTIVLDAVLAEQPLRLICYYASSAAILGDMGACSYAIANRFQQAYARYVQAGRAQRVVTINWPLWRNGGMGLGDSAATQLYLQTSGQRLLENAEGWRLLRQIIASNVDQMLVLTGEPEKLQQWVSTVNDPSKKIIAHTKVEKSILTIPPHQIRPELKGLNLEQAVLWDLRDLACRPLHAERHQLDAERNLADFGFDSISLAEYARLLSQHFGVKFTPELFFSHSTLAKICVYFLAQKRQLMENYYLLNCPVASQETAVQSIPIPIPLQGANSTTDTIAIIGISGRFPGARNPDELWQLLATGRDMVSEIPADRYDWREYYGDARTDSGKTRCIWMGSVPGVAEFDPLFFEISPREAKLLDPRQRLLLQESWNALENAGIGPQQLKTQRVGMFVGVEEGDFQRLAGAENLTSNHNGILASRLAYFLNLTGPTMALNTACSSALVALHQATLSLRNHECEMVIVAGVNLIFSPDAFIGMTQAGMLSPDGKCFTFDRRANGMVPGEAVCCVVLKPLAQAEADGDPIYAVLRASGINYDGKTNGITAPSGASQERLLEDVYQRAKIDSASIEYIVTHGTGTQLGDPVEINALNNVFNGNQPGHCALTSIKTNVGHTFAASGLVSVISLLQAMRHETIPASLHCEQENDNIDWQKSPFYVNKINKPWPQAERTSERRGAVSAFGMSGTNAHVVLESYRRINNCTAFLRPCYLLVLSAKTAQALQEKVAQLNTALEQEGYLDNQLPSISYTLLEGRHQFRYRLALVAADLEEARYSLQQYLLGEKHANLFIGTVEQEFTAQKTIQRYLQQLLNDSRQGNPQETRELLCGVADFYRQGYHIDGRQLFVATQEDVAPQRLVLPSYPFSREHYWPERIVPSPILYQNKLHPLVHRNISTLSVQCFASSFNGREQFLLDHRIGNQLYFPATAYLELARSAIVLASQLAPQQVTLQNIVWLQPLTFALDGANSEVTLYCALGVNTPESLTFKIYSMDGATEQCHAQGDAQLTTSTTPPPWCDLSQLTAHCQLGERSHEDLYRDFENNGMYYGTSYRAARKIHIGQNLVVGQLQPNALDAQMDGALLPPGVLDSALHIATALGRQRSEKNQQALPFALEKLHFYGSLEQALRAGSLTVVVTTPATPPGAVIEKINLQICDATGACLVQLDGFSSRPTSGLASLPQPATSTSTSSDETLGSVIRIPSWERLDSPAELIADAKPWLFLLGFSELVEQQLRQRFGSQVVLLLSTVGESDATTYQAAALALFENLKRLVRNNNGSFLQLFVGYSQDDLRWLALDAMLKTVTLENNTLKTRLVALDLAMGDSTIVRTISEQSRYQRNQLVRVLANGSLYARQWHPLQGAPIDYAQQNKTIPFRDNGIYAITGGAGGLGLIFSELIVANCRHPVLYLAGRSALTAQIQQKIDKLQQQGAYVAYRVMDVSEAVAVKQWIDEIYAKKGALHGVIHSAGIIRDSMIMTKTAREFTQVLAVKVAGIEALDQAIDARPLDFLLCCSSQAAMGNLGQADYAAANAYMDGFMHYRQNLAADGKRKGRSLSINWPLWRDGGMRVPAIIAQQMRQQFGIVPMPVEEGLQSLQQLLTNSVSAQGWVVYGELVQLANIGQLLPAQALPNPILLHTPQTTNAVSMHERTLKKQIETFITEIIAKVAQIDITKIHPTEKFEVYGFDSMLAVGVTNELEKYLGSLPKTLLFEHINIAGMAAHFAVKYQDHFIALFATHPSPFTQTAASFDIVKAETALPLPRFSSTQVNTSSLATAQNFPVVAAQITDQECENYIAVIGLGGYYPGAENIAELWKNLAGGIDYMRDFPVERWDHSKIYYKNRDVLGKSTCLNGAFIEDIDKFDYSYFKMPKVYADHMSPEVRLFLQAAVHTFEDAGYSKETMLSRYDGNVGVLLGTMTNDYHYYGFESNLLRGAMASGSGMATIPMTVSYFYGLTGPSLFIDTMCSSSLTCIHTACQMLKHDETKMVLAGGLNLMYHPYTTVNTSQGNFTSVTSKTVNSYGVGADGTVIGEGVGAVLLKRLDRAILERDQIYGVIKGSAITNAGERNGFNVPNPDLQTQAICKAMEQANVHPSTITYIEGHGSGTKLGDPIEVLGLKNAFNVATQDKQFCYLGSIKSNIGHLLAASGVAGLSKILLQLKHQKIAPSLHSGRLNHDIDFVDSPFMVPQKLIEWPQPERIIDGHKQVFPRRAGLTSIAAGGMNAHMVIEEYPVPSDAAGQISDDHLVFIFSVHKLSVLKENLSSFRDWLLQHTVPLAQIAYTLQVGKNNLRNRLAIRCHSRQALLAALQVWINDHEQISTSSHIFYHFQENNTEQPLMHHGDDPFNFLLRQWLAGDNVIDWASLYIQLPLRISLPVYRFEKVRCWYTAEGQQSAILDPWMFQRKLHPLVGESRPTLQPGATFRTHLIKAELQDYIYRSRTGNRLSAFNFADVALAIPALVTRFEGCTLSISCAFEYDIADWETLLELEYRVCEIDTEQLELEFDFCRSDQQLVNLGFAVINPISQELAQPQLQLREQVQTLLQQLQTGHALSAAEVSQRLIQAGYDFTPYLEPAGELITSAHGLLLRSQAHVHRHNHYANNLKLSPYLATTIDKACYLLQATLGLPQSRVVVATIEQLCCYHLAPAGFSVLLTEITLTTDGLSLSVLILDEQAQICINIKRVSLYLGTHELTAIDRDHCLLAKVAAIPVTAIDQVAFEPTPALFFANQQEGTRECDTAALSTPILIFIQQQLQEKLGFMAQEIGASIQVHDLGLDSVMIVQLTNSINKRFGTKLMPDVFYEKQQLGELVAKLEVV